MDGPAAVIDGAIDDIEAPAPPARGRLDLIRADVLLWNLQQFADPPIERVALGALPTWVRAEVYRLAALPRAPYGDVRRLSDRSGRSHRSLSVQVSQIRRGARRRAADA